MVEIQIDYKGQLRCVAEHMPSGKKVMSDAPVDNQGRGESFSQLTWSRLPSEHALLPLWGLLQTSGRLT